MNKSITTIATLGIITLITGCSSSMSTQFAPGAEEGWPTSPNDGGGLNPGGPNDGTNPGDWRPDAPDGPGNPTEPDQGPGPGGPGNGGTDPGGGARGSAPLFNGESLEGWTIVNGDKTTWVAQSNMIVTTGNPTGIMRTNEMYENFILELDWRHMVTNGNAGLFVWSDPIPAIGVPFTRSIEVQIMDGKELDWYTTHGDIFSIWGAQMTPDRPHPLGAHVQRCLPSERRSNPAPEWNHYIVTCIDGTIKLSVNGKVVSGGFDITPRKGYICFEAEGTPAQFKNIIIKVLPNSTPEIPESEIANESIGFVTLFNGINLQGWVTSDETNWNAGGNILHCSKGSGMLTTSTSLKAYELMFDFKCNAEMSSAFVEIDGIKTTLPEGEMGKWSRFTIQGEDKTIGIGGDDASFTNVFIRPLQ